MNPDEYAAQQALISAAIAQYTLRFGLLFRQPHLTVLEWLGLLEFLYPQVEFHRQQAATLAREFYDHQRAVHHPDLPRNDQHLETYTFERFVHDMDPARERMSQIDASEDAIAQVAHQAVRAVENAGRQQIIHAVQDDKPLKELQDAAPEEHVVRGWARVATGRETCAWCLMLVSRGPVYLGADNAGLDLSDSEVKKIWKDSGGDLEKFLSDTENHMEQWHPNCDCKVVPVFKLESWPGKVESERALELWKDATLEAIQEEEDDPDRVHRAGKNIGKPFTRNERALNALRRQLALGEIDPVAFAAAA